ncbi:hypothetical protein [Chryseobacterium sp. CP-77]|uniref:hypothetical protein n=1 Tax=Chryseobacterium sp. CP-77 TaxID=3116594 RepID=UPI002ED4D994
MKRFFDALLANSILTFLKEYFAIIIFVPTLLGGLGQLYQLVSLSPSLIEYFSISQLLIDGILILIRSPLYLIGILSYGFYLAIKNDKRQHIKFWITLFFAFMALALNIYRDFVDENYYKLFKSFMLLGINIFFIFLYKNMGNAKTSLKIFGLVITAVLFSILLNILDRQFDYNSIENISLLTDKVKAQYPKAEFRYYNDKFVIFENTTNQRYIIKEFGDLFKENDLKDSSIETK